MISAKEARCRVENAKAIKELEKRLDFAIAAAIEKGNYKISAVAPKELTEEGYDVVTKELTELGYIVQVERFNDFTKILTLEW